MKNPFLNLNQALFVNQPFELLHQHDTPLKHIVLKYRTLGTSTLTFLLRIENPIDNANWYTLSHFVSLIEILLEDSCVRFLN